MEVELKSYDQHDFSSADAVVLDLDKNDLQKQQLQKGMEVAVDVDHVNLSFGSNHVLTNLCMRLPRGAIYGLLGPSGCGKTSLIRCILGSLRTSSGTIHVFGQSPGGAHAMVPGPGVGYMPQETSLSSFLTIEETLHYYGRLYNMPYYERAKRINFLVDFLELPDKRRRVGELSGGQKRRVSLASALVHKPPLLILDEPTVGVDPLLRKIIWEHLIELSVSERITVLITTHYIEEAKDANLVGLMRNGLILEQASPASLLERHQLNTLEQVFLYVCQNDARNRPELLGDQQTITNNTSPKMLEAIEQQSRENLSRRHSASSSSSGVDSIPNNDHDSLKSKHEESLKPTEHSNQQVTLYQQQQIVQHYRPPKVRRTSALSQMRAMSYKNVISLLRSPGYMLFQFFLPTLEVVLFCLCIGLKLHSIPVAVFDGDNSTLSSQFLLSLDSYTIHQQKYNSSEGAISAVRKGKASSALILDGNFSACLKQRLNMLGEVEPQVLHNSTIHLHPDMSNQLMVMSVYNEVLRSFTDIAKQYISSMGFSTNLLDMPIKMEEPVYGHPDPPYTEFMAPGVILSITFLAAIPLTTMVIVVERREGLIERSVVAGASHFYILLSHLWTQTSILIVQVLLLMVVVFPVFRIPYHGEFIPIMGLTLSQSFCGLAFGLLVSAISNSENTATMLSLGAFYPMLLLSGTVWPINAMGKWLKYFALCLPQTIPILSMRDMVSRGWTLTSWGVLRGFTVTYVWILVFLGLSTLIFRRRQW